MSEIPPPAEPNRKRRRYRLRRVLKWLICLALVLLIGGELVARFYLGLGNPPLSMFDPDMEYRFDPSMTYHRFGNLVHFNAYSQRADDFPPHKSSPDELRVMVIGDSVINGGSLLDQSRTCTAILQRELREHLHRPVIVGNISAGSWGPPNELAYVKKFGLFDADVVLLVLSSHDATDVMTFVPTVGVAPEFPQHRPISALWEGLTRYLPPRLPAWLHHAPPIQTQLGMAPEAADEQARQRAVTECVSAATEIIQRARDAHAIALLALHLTPEEQANGPDSGHEDFEKMSARIGITPIELGGLFHQAMQKGENPYRDGIHPNVAGTQLMADAFDAAVEQAVAHSPATTQAEARPVPGH